MSPTAQPPWRVSYLVLARERLKEWAREATLRGISIQFEAAALQAMHHLGVDPEEWGDPIFHFHQLGLLVLRGPTALFYVEYAVDPTNRLVYVRSVHPTPGSPLSQ